MTDRPPRGQAELDALDAVFGALSHPTRRAILSVLHANGSEMSSKVIAQRFAIAWPTTTHHLRVLEEAGLIEQVHRGGRHHYTLRADVLTGQVGTWLARFQ